MALSSGKAFEGLSKFVKDVPTERLTKVRFELRHHLNKVHRNPLVSNWLYENYDILDRNLYPVMVHANETLDKATFSMMTMALLCKLPDNLEDLSLVAGNLDSSDQSDIFNLSLCKYPRQDKVSFEILGEIVDFIIVVQNQDLVAENKEKLLALPVSKWKSQLDDWQSSGLGGARHNKPHSYYIKELQEANWKICQRSAR